MTLLRDVLSELLSMFLGDARLSLAVVALIGLASAMIRLAGTAPLLAGAALLAGCMVILAASTLRAAARKKRE